MGYVFRSNEEKSKAFVERDEKALSPSYTRSYGFVMSHGEGSVVWDIDGNRYIDFAAGIAVLSTGHRHPKILEAIKKQTEKYIHIGATDFFCPSQLELAEKLQQITQINGVDNPEDIMTYFGNSGTEAVEAALKLARYQPGNRRHIIAFYGAFHGRTMGSLSVTASKAVQRAEYPFIPGGVEHVPYPTKSDCNDNADGWCDAAGFIEQFVIKRKVPGDEIAAIIVEPIQGEGGYHLPADGFLASLRELCDKYGILLISDEIQAGAGRSGKWLAMEHWGVKPDIVCMAKGLGSGFPIGATIASRKVMGEWIPGAHASTFGGNPLACAVASATIDVIMEDGILEHTAKMGEYVLERMGKFKQNHPSIKRVGGKGLMIGIEFANASGKAIGDFRNKVVDECFLNGLVSLAAGTSVLRIAPPLVITKEELSEGLDILETAIGKLEEEHWEHINE